MNRPGFPFMPLLMSVLLVSLVACGSGEGDGDVAEPEAGDAPASSSEPDPAATAPDDAEMTAVRMGTIPVYAAAAAYIADSQGYYAEENLEVELPVGSGFQVSLAQLLSGENQFAFASMIPVLAAASRDADLAVIAQTDIGAGAPGAVMTNSDSGITTATDLPGKTVAVNALGAGQEIGIRSVVDGKGGDSDSIEFVELPIPQMTEALTEGLVEAAAISEPFATQAQDQGKVKIFDYLQDGFPSEAPMAVYFTTREYADANPDVVASMQRALNRATDYAAENDEAVREAMRNFTEIDPDLLARMPLGEYRSEMSRDGMNQLQELLVQYGLMETTIDLDEIIIEAG